MKGFLGALLLTLGSAIAGIVAANGFHEVLLSAGRARTVVHANAAEAAARQNTSPIKQRVNYADIERVPTSEADTGGI